MFYMSLDKLTISQRDLNEHRQNSITEYEKYRMDDNDALCIGLFREDLERAFTDERTVYYERTTDKNETVHIPVLVHVDSLEWWNSELFRELYPSKDVFVYTHPNRLTEIDDEEITKVLEAAVSLGFVIATEKYKLDETSPIAKFIKKCSDEKPDSVITFGDNELPSSVDYFATEVNFFGADTKKSPSIFTVYEQMIDEGIVKPNEPNGVSIAREISGNEANKIWQLYKLPFDNLGKNDPTKAGYSEEMLKELLSDPNVLKVVNRSDSEITTLLLLLDKLSDAPWFNENYYRNTYPEFYDTGNIVISPCVVTDEEKQGNDYALDTLDFMAQIYARRGSNVILSFECTQISTQYVPAITRYVLEKSGLLSLSSLEAPIGTIQYFGIDNSTISG
jgi:hypothetical protein